MVRVAGSNPASPTQLAHHEESVGGFIAPDWAYEPTPTLEEFKAKHRSALSDSDVLVD